jgi:hypothetical protein
MSGLFALDGDYVGDIAPQPSKPAQPVQSTLFAMYQDRQRKPAARRAEPSIMDFLADHPKPESK